jgi:pilus assembly protein CpaF
LVRKIKERTEEKTMAVNMQFEDDHAAKLGQQTTEGAVPYESGLKQVRDRIANEFNPQQIDNAGPLVTEAASRTAHEIYSAFNQEALSKNMPRIMIPEGQFVEMVLADLLGMGAVDALLSDPTVEDIAINGPTEVMVYRHGHWEETDVTFPSSDRLLEILNRGLAHSNRKANMVTPIADAVLKGKQRISVVTNPIATPHPTAVIRIPRAKDITLEDMIKPSNARDDDHSKKIPIDYESLLDGEAEGLLSPKAAQYLHAVVLAGGNIVAIGPTGSGKTTLLMALGRKIPEGERILIIEDTPEIDLHPHTDKPQNVLYLRTRPSTVEGLREIPQEDLVKLALRQRPDALTLGEARGPEVFDLLNALNTGHKNGLTSLHAYGVDELFGRIFLMLSQSERGRHLDAYRAANLVASTLHVAVSIEMVGNTRFVKTIAELTGKVKKIGTSYEPEVKPIFQRSGKHSKLEGPLADSAHANLFHIAGIPKDVYSAE